MQRAETARTVVAGGIPQRRHGIAAVEADEGRVFFSNSVLAESLISPTPFKMHKRIYKVCVLFRYCIYYNQQM